MDANRDRNGRKAAEGALIEALTAPAEASMVDALLVVPDDAAGDSHGMASGFQAALAAKIRSVIGDRQTRKAA